MYTAMFNRPSEFYLVHFAPKLSLRCFSYLAYRR
jgi:hypothetical protein